MIFIPLGVHCSTKGHINAFFKKDTKDAYRTIPGQAELFDWVRLAECLEHRLDRLFERHGERAVQHWPHLFHTQFDGEALGSDFDEAFVDKEYPRLRQKLRDKFLGARDAPTLYVIAARDDGMSRETMVRLRDALVVARDGDRRFTVPQRKTFDGSTTSSSGNAGSTPSCGTTPPTRRSGT